MLTELIIEEATFLHNVRDQVKTLRDELKWMQSFLRDADTKQESDNRIQQWVSEIRDLVFDAEDTIDNYILEIEEEKRTEPTRRRRIQPRKGIKATVKNYMFCICNKGIELHKIGNDIAAIQKRLNDISSKREMYGIRNIGEGASSLSEKLRKSRRSSPYEDEDDFTGLDETVKELVAQVTGDELRRCVISIVGMGGLGKTSLAKKIYNHTSIKSLFHDRAWVYVSQEYSIVDLLRKIIKSFIKPSKEVWEMIEMMETEEDLEGWLFNFLEGRRYLVVLDDVWDSEAWKCLKRAFPNRNEGSRVLLTTRKWDVASSVDDTRNPPHQLRFLTKEESWELFCKKVFPNNCGDDPSFCSPGFEELGRKMVEKCDGLPLGIIVLGGLLSKKQPSSLNEWNRVLDHISQNLMQEDKGHISQILSLSYNDLPYQLKPCFLYMGLFSEDSSINTKKLIQLWVAEGFIPQGEELMEDVANDYLNELIERSMIQAEMKNWRGVVTCRIHDLLRDLSIYKAKEERFLDIFEKVDDSPLSETSLQRQPRRLIIHFDQINSLQHLTLAAGDLLYLSLEGKFEGLPNNLHQFSPNLTHVSLMGCELKEDSMSMLEKLPNLLELNLYPDAYRGKEIICLRNGFPRLEVLDMVHLRNLVEWRVEEGAMPRLKITLKINGCMNLENLPEGLKFLTSLSKLEFRDMFSVFENKVQREDFYKVQHIPSITFQ